ncbi:MAG: hypothetical protein LUD22_00145 [Coprobacillus sp.]|nr:hypothetical protein [Coprobacillus sp.]
MKMKKTLLPLILISSVLCSSCSSYLSLRAGTWQNDQSITFEEHDLTIESVRIEIVENTDPDFVYDDFNAVRDDGGEYLGNTGLILYLYLDDVAVIDLSLFTWMSDSWRHGTYLYNETYTIGMRARLNNDRKNKTTYFETIFYLYEYPEGDPYSYVEGSQESSTPYTVYLYEV